MGTGDTLGLLAIILFVQAYCAAWVYGLLRLVQLLGLESDTIAGRAVAGVAAIAGVGAAIWTLHRAYKWWRQ